MIATLKKAARKIMPKRTYSWIRGLIKPVKISYYTPTEIKERMGRFGLKKVAILTDGRTDLTALLNYLSSEEKAGIYSFNLDLIGTKISGHEVRPLPAGIKTSTDGWIVSALGEGEGFSMNRHLLDSGTENQVILQHVKNTNGTKYYSYIDFFSNEQTTVVQINNYFRRCYALAFPLDLKLTLRDITGKVRATRQVIIPPDAIKVIKSEDFPISGFAGYLEVEFELAKKVSPFLHYMADYFAPDFISSNHQSGLGLHPAGSEFTRGYIPIEPDKTLEVCLFQHNYENPIVPLAILEYTDEKGTRIRKTKDFPPLHKKEMQYTDVKQLFNEIDFSKTHSPCISVKSDVPLHRPNYYYVAKGHAGYYDTSHAGPDLKNFVKSAYRGIPEITADEKKKMDDLGVFSMDLKHHILPKDLNIESIISIGGNDSTAFITDFHIDLHTFEGKFVRSFEEKFDFERQRYLNLNKYLSKKGLADFTGTISFRPGRNATVVPINLNSITGYIHKQSNHLTSTAGNGSGSDNIPFYFRNGPPSYMKVKAAAGTTDIFARGISNDEFDTVYTVSYQTADKNLDRKIKYEIQLTDAQGKKKTIYRTLAPNACDVLRLSDLINETGHTSEGGFYTVWLFSSEAHLYAQHLLIRKRDNAIALEHLYAGKFGL